MLKIVYIEDSRRPERNAKFKKFIEALAFDGTFEFCDSIEVKVISSIQADGVICHSGMDGYNVVKHFAKKYRWPLLAYSGSVETTPYLRPTGTEGRMFTVDSKYFEDVLPDFIKRCEDFKRVCS